MRNRLNHLTPKQWIKFQKSWFVHTPPRRREEVLLHPAKFPETLVGEFIRFFTKKGQTVLDPMAGTGSALVAALEAGRNAIGVELLEKYARIAAERCRDMCDSMPSTKRRKPWFRLVVGDASHLSRLLRLTDSVDYVITSPPYWDMLRRKGFETQKKRRQAALDVHYSEDPRDLGNLDDYQAFLERLVGIYAQVADLLRPRAYLTIIVKNVKKGGTVYPLAWDLAKGVSAFLRLKDERIWCQDDVKLAPYGMGSAWVSNTCHHYCLNFRKE
jgi:DNA modification methylase